MCVKKEISIGLPVYSENKGPLTNNVLLTEKYKHQNTHIDSN